MRLEILSDFDKELVQLKLVNNEDGIAVVAIDHRGDEWYLLSLKNDGKMKLYSCLADQLGFQLDNRGCIIVE